MKYATTDLILAAGFGWLSGMRSMAGPSLAGGRLLRNDTAKTLLAAAAGGEILVDKLPWTPNRNAREPLAARVAAGAATGAAIVVSGSGWRGGRPIRSRNWTHHDSSRDTIEAAAVGAIIGGVSAFIATHASYHIRRRVSEKTNAPNAALGAAEDAIVYGTGALMAHGLD